MSTFSEPSGNDDNAENADNSENVDNPDYPFTLKPISASSLATSAFRSP